MNKRVQNAREQQEDATLNKVLLWIVGAVVLEFLVLLLNRFYVNNTVEQIPVMVAIHDVLPILAVVFLVLFVAGLLCTLVRYKGGKSVGLVGGLTILLFGLALSTFIARRFYGTGLRLLYIGIPVIAVLALIYYLYQREFFSIAAISVLGILGIWMAQRVGGENWPAYVYMVGLAVFLVGALVVFRVLQTSGGILKLGGKNREILHKSANYPLIYITCVLVAAVVIAALVLGSLVLLYGVLVAWLLIMAVYYTVKLM